MILKAPVLSDSRIYLQDFLVFGFQSNIIALCSLQQPKSFLFHQLTSVYLLINIWENIEVIHMPIMNGIIYLKEMIVYSNLLLWRKNGVVVAWNCCSFSLTKIDLVIIYVGEVVFGNSTTFRIFHWDHNISTLWNNLWDSFTKITHNYIIPLCITQLGVPECTNRGFKHVDRFPYPLLWYINKKSTLCTIFINSSLYCMDLLDSK